jgi:undecaprenyl-diphosphatase
VTTSFRFSLLFLALFLLITLGLLGGFVGGVDWMVLAFVTHERTPWLTSTALSITALGSDAVVILFSAIAVSLFAVWRDRMAAVQVVAAAVGASLLTLATKNIIERVRPPDAERLIAVSGFSYPSGHSLAAAALYATLAMVACRHVKETRARSAVYLCAAAVMLLVGGSRAYLGVHYASDVAGGLSLGTGWALALGGGFDRIRAQ